jgi:hypothetical protein
MNGSETESMKNLNSTGVIAIVVTWRRRPRRPEVEEMPNIGLRKRRRHGLRQLLRRFF